MLLADFQQFYGLDASAMGLGGTETTRDVLRAATLMAQLPPESRLARHEHPELRWGDGEWMLWRIELELRALMWGMSDRKRRGKAPRPAQTPVDAERIRRKVLRTDYETIARELGLEGRV